MYEIFMTAMVEDADFASTCSILSGLCAMEPWQSASRVLYYQGPSKPVGLTNQSSIEKPIRRTIAPLWKELHQSLSRQSFVLQARYDIQKDRDMGSSASNMNLDSTAGILRWTDFPDPPQGKPVLTQRKKVELWEQKNLPSILRDNQHQFKAETIEEIYRFFRDEIEFSLVKQYFFKPIAEFTPLESRNGVVAEPSADLPSWDALTPVDMQNRWILQAKVHVLQDNKPDEIRKGQDKLTAVRNELEGVFEFRNIDRKVHDTRVAQQMQGIQALPQKVKIGKT